MSKITLTTVPNLLDATTAATAINTNFNVIKGAIDTSLSRDGTSPNQLAANIDMNSYRILNLPQATLGNEPVTLTTFNAAIIGKGNAPVGGTVGQFLRKNTSTDFDYSWGGISGSLLAGNNISLSGSGVVTIGTVSTPSFTTVNGLTFTAGTGTMTLNNSIATFNNNLTVNNGLTLAGTNGTTITFQGTDTYVGRTTTDTFTNKTFNTAGTGNVFQINGTGITAVTGSGSVVLGTTPTITTPVINGTISGTTVIPAANGGTGLSTYAQYDIVYASAANTVGKLSTPSGVAQVLRNSGGSGVLAWGQLALGADVSGQLGIANGGTGATSATNARVNLATVGVVKTQVFTVSGTYTPSTGMLYCIVEAVGGGGAGGGAIGSAGASIFTGGGGGAGNYSFSVLSAATIGASQTVTIGAAGGGSTGASGGAGTDTSLGVLVIGKGGAGGTVASSVSAPNGGAGGVAGTGTHTVPGNAGSGGLYNSTSNTTYTATGQGGGSHWGGASVPIAAGNGAVLAGNAAAANSGAGGSGGSANAIASNAAGGNGGTGYLKITEFCNQ